MINLVSDKPHYENVPFEIPESWEWVRLDEVCNIKGGKRIPKGKGFSDFPTKHIYIRVTDMKKNTILDNDIQYIDEEVFTEICNYTISKDDLYLTIAGTIGAVGEVPELFDGMNLTENAAKLTHIQCNKKYLMYALLSTSSQEHFKSRFHQVAQPKLSIETAASTNITLPPLTEQQRIVSKLQKWFSLIDKIDQDKVDLQKHIKQIKSKVLDLAIHGKLVPQDPNDEPAIELLKRINPNFKSCDTSHYENLPDGWAICLLEDIVNYEQPTQYIVESTDYDDEYKTPVLTAGKSFILGYTNESKGIYNNLPTIIFDDFTTDSRLVDFPFKVKSSAMKILQVNKEINIQYVAYFMSITRLVGNTHKRYWISEYSKIPIPIPPKEEQNRIVQVIAEIEKELQTISAEL